MKRSPKMEETYDDLLEQIRSDSFSALSGLEILSTHYDNIGVTHLVVQRLREFKYVELEFYIPQFIQLMVSFETDSMALSDLLLDYSSRFPHFCLITFWYLQSYIYELRNNPDSYSFHVVRSFINDIQNIMFNNEETIDNEVFKFRENVHPALVLTSSSILSFCLPVAVPQIKPIVISQSKQRKAFLFKLANFHKSLTRNNTLKNRAISSDSFDKSNIQSRHSEGNAPLKLASSISKNDDSVNSYSDTELLDRDIHINTKIKSKKASNLDKRKSEDSSRMQKSNVDLNSKLATHSMPDLRTNEDAIYEAFPITPTLSNSSSVSLASFDAIPDSRLLSKKQVVNMSNEQKIKHLHVNYFKKETEFIMTLQNISIRLSQVPKEARLTSLRAELAIINNSILPSEIDIPQMFPSSTLQNKKFHKILKLNVNEACVLNSAERVPFLLLIEYLSEEIDFNPESDYNKSIIFGNNSPGVFQQRKAPSRSPKLGLEESMLTSENEEDLGDTTMVALANQRHFMAKQISPNKLAGLNQSVHNKPQIPNTENSGTQTITSTTSTTKDGLSTKDLSTQMRIAAVMLRQLEKSGQANSEQAAQIKSRIIESMKQLQDKFENISYEEMNEINSVSIGQNIPDAGSRKLENDFKLGEDWQTKKDRIRKSSIYGYLRNWELCSVIAKNGDDLPQEAFACQLISLISKIWNYHSVSAWTKNIKILVTSANSGLVETINNAMSIHSIKKSLTEITINSGENTKGTIVSIKDYFVKIYGDETSAKYKMAQDNFARSLAAYSIICYVLQIKDRHNGNIMLDNEGHIIHIDFGFLLSNSPGSVGFEAAPFKLTQEYVDVLGGNEGEPYLKFKELCKQCFAALRKNCDQLVNLVNLMSKDSSLPCFKNGAQTSVLLKQRMQLELNDEDCDNFVEYSLIGKSLGSVYTRLYDQFQLLTQGIYP